MFSRNQLQYSTTVSIQSIKMSQIYHLMINIHMWGTNHLVSCCTVKLFNSFLNHSLAMHCIRKGFFLTSLWIKLKCNWRKHHQIENCCKSMKKTYKNNRNTKNSNNKKNQLHFPYVLWFFFLFFTSTVFYSFSILFFFLNISSVLFKLLCYCSIFLFAGIFSVQAVCTLLMLFHSRDNDDLFHFVH